MKRSIESYSGHTIVCGYGRMGKVICADLDSAQHPFVIVEKEKSLIEELKRTRFLWIEGDAADDSTLIEAGINRCSVLVSAIDNDADGLYLSLVARSLNPECSIIVRANHERSYAKLLNAGADRVILPFVSSGRKVAESIINPASAGVFNFTGHENPDDLSIQMFDIPVKASSCLEGLCLQTFTPREKGLIIVGIRKPDGDFLFAPKAQQPFEIGDHLVALGSPEAYQKAVEDFNIAVADD